MVPDAATNKSSLTARAWLDIASPPIAILPANAEIQHAAAWLEAPPPATPADSSAPVQTAREALRADAALGTHAAKSVLIETWWGCNRQENLCFGSADSYEI